MRLDHTVWKCDQCGEEVESIPDIKGWPRHWYTLATLGDQVAAQHLCSLKCVIDAAKTMVRLDADRAKAEQEGRR